MISAIPVKVITRGVLAQSPEPEAHDKALDNNPDRIGIMEMLGFVERRKSEYPEKNLSRQGRESTTNSNDALCGIRTRATLVGDECRCTIPAPLCCALPTELSNQLGTSHYVNM